MLQEVISNALLQPMTFSPELSPAHELQQLPQDDVGAQQEREVSSLCYGTGGTDATAHGPSAQVGPAAMDQAVDKLTDQVHGLDVGDGLAPDPAHFLGAVFKMVPTPVLPPPEACEAQPPTPARPRVEPASTQRRSSLHQANKKSVVPVAHRATVRLIQQLDLNGGPDVVGDDAVKLYTDMFKKPLPSEALAALRRATRTDNDEVMAMAAVMAPAEEEARLAAT
jgi:hypothetical protein